MKRAVIRAVVFGVLAGGVLAAQQQRPQDVELQAAIRSETVDGTLTNAIVKYRAIVEKYGRTDRAVSAQALLRMAEAYQKLGDSQARATYERIVREFADQLDPASAARTRLASLTGSRVANASALGLLCVDCSDHEASISRDGRWMATTDWDSGDLRIRDMATGQVHRLLVKAGTMKDAEEYAEAPVFSPDVSQIAYVWDPVKDGVPAQLRVVANQIGAIPRVLVDSPAFSWPAAVAWSADGKRVLVDLEKPDETRQLAWISTTDGRIEVLKSLDWRLGRSRRWARVSPDGRFIAYSARVTNPGPPPPPRQPDVRDLGEENIYVLAADGSAETEVVKTAGRDQAPMWSPDGSHLLFQSDRSGAKDLWALPVRDGRPAGPAVVVRRNLGEDSALGITDTGVYHLNRLVRGLQQVSVMQFDMTGKLPATVRMVDSLPAAINPSWSPDGKLLYTRSRLQTGRETFLTVVHDMVSGEEKALTRLDLREGGPRYHTSNTEFLQMLVPPGQAQQLGPIYSIDLQTGSFREVLPSNSRSGAAALSRDGKTIYQFARDPGTPRTSPFTRVVAVDLTTAQERTVVRLPGSADTLPMPGALGLAMSPDGNTLALATTNPKTGESRVSRVGVDGMQFRDLLGPLAHRRGLAWTRDGRYLLFATSDDLPMWKLMRMSAEGGQPEFTGLTARGLSQPSFSPDGSRIAFMSNSNSEDELWAVDVSWVWTGKR